MGKKGDGSARPPGAPDALPERGVPADVVEQASRRRTFAVISHPDAGKSTLTEALAAGLRQGQGEQSLGAGTALPRKELAPSGWT